jgi:hypothetical protein
MSSHKANNQNGGNFARAASATEGIRDAARAENLRAFAPGLALMAFTATMLVLNASTLWPNLFPH